MNKRVKIFLASIVILCLCQAVAADRIELPDGMGGVPNIGAIPCEVYSKMLVYGPQGTRLSLLTWAEGYFFAKTGKTLSEILADAPDGDDTHDFYAITDRFVDYCAANPEAITSEAVMALGGQLVAAGQ